MKTIKISRKYFVIGLLLSISQALMAQQVVTGRITDIFDGLPIAEASVFIANTTIGTTSGTTGHYSLTVPGRGSFEIVVSHVAYQSVFHKIDVSQDAHRYDVALEIAEIEEIVISAAKTYSNSDVNLFWRELLGEKPARNGMQILNPEIVYFYKNDNVLRASCREPIEIVNHHAGYRIRYVLQSFRYNFSDNSTEISGMPYFEELTPRNNREKDRWEKKRQEVYAVSINRFMRALNRKNIHEEGFVLLDKTVLMQGFVYPVSLEDILQVDRDVSQLSIDPSLILLNYSKPVTEQMIQDIQPEDIVTGVAPKTDENRPTVMEHVASQKSSWVVQPREQPSFDDQVNQSISRNSRTTPPNIIVELMPSQVTVFANGTYNGLLNVSDWRRDLSGLNSRVPVEYPEIAQNISYGLTVIPSYGLLKAEENITTQLEVYPQEKIHLHTDRDFYIPGEKIWFKAYLVDAQTHLNQTESWYAYIELISPADTLVNSVMITQTDGMFHGYLPISALIPEGNYTLRAYTRYMENLGDDYFFKKNIRIGNLSSARHQTPDIRHQTLQENRNRQGSLVLHTNRIEDDYDVSFFPEGGNLPEGVFSKVTFKAINKIGYTETISGTLVDETGTEIVSAKTVHAGMGILKYIPQAGKRYYFKCKNGNGIEKQFELPQSNPHAYTLSVSPNNNNLSIEVKRSVQAPKTTNYLLAHCRGTVLYFSELDKEKTNINFARGDLPAGVIQFILFDEKMNPLSERLIFNKNDDATATIEFQTDKENYQIRDKITATLSFSDSLFYFPFSLPFGEGRGGVFGHFSIAITDDKDIAVDETTTIPSSLLLSSELKGYIENPAFYLQDDVAMDLLMMTHGWRRYNIPEVAKGKIEKPQIPFQTFQNISGHVTNLTGNRQIPGGEVLMTTKGGGIGISSTDVNGSFTISELDFPDSTTFYIRALDRNGRDNIRLVIENESFPALVYASQSPITNIKTEDTETKAEPAIDAFLEKAEQRAKFDEDIWMLQLEEVAITAPAIKRVEPRGQYWANASSDKSITKETIEDFKFPYVFDYLYTAGLRYFLEEKEVEGDKEESIESNKVITSYYYFERNIVSINSGMDALILIDGFAQHLDRYMPSDEVESIDIFTGVGATAFGVRGAGGVVSITTKVGPGANHHIERSNQVVFTPLGYQKPVEFYSPKYETLAAKQSVIPDLRTTVFWKPDLVISEDGKVSFEFYTSDNRTTYSVVIEGITSDGRMVRQVVKIRVE